MTAKIIDGKAFAANVREKVAGHVGLAERLWREMIDHFIAQEEQVLGKGNGS